MYSRRQKDTLKCFCLIWKDLNHMMNMDMGSITESSNPALLLDRYVQSITSHVLMTIHYSYN
jgi:hypothetical protein